MRLQTLVTRILMEKPETRDSDKKLAWEVWESLGFVVDGSLHYTKFMDKDCPSHDSITRCRRKIQEETPTLQATEPVRKARSLKAQEKGKSVFVETVSGERKKISGYKFIGDKAVPIYE